jgi:hypothetical protein
MNANERELKQARTQRRERDRLVRLGIESDAAERVASKLAEVVRVAADMMKRAPIGEGCQLRVMGFPEDVVQVMRLAKKLMPMVRFESKAVTACEPHGNVMVELEIRAK